MDISQELLHGYTSLLKHGSEEFMVSSFESISNKGMDYFIIIIFLYSYLGLFQRLT